MDVQEIITGISTLGFPIICCLLMMYYVKYSTDNHREEVSKLNEEHRKEMTEVTEALNNNTLALQKLCDYISIKDAKNENSTN